VTSSSRGAERFPEGGGTGDEAGAQAEMREGDAFTSRVGASYPVTLRSAGLRAYASLAWPFARVTVNKDGILIVGRGPLKRLFPAWTISSDLVARVERFPLGIRIFDARNPRQPVYLFSFRRERLGTQIKEALGEPDELASSRRLFHATSPAVKAYYIAAVVDGLLVFFLALTTIRGFFVAVVINVLIGLAAALWLMAKRRH
jgi:hypothetical protein